MKLLLDTHIWLWSHLEPERLGREVRVALEAPESELWLSPISVWEFLLLVEKRRIVLTTDPASWIASAWSVAPMKEASLTREVALCSRAVEVPHEDPADRFIAATAAVYGLTLVTQDKHLLDGRGYHIMPNR